MRPRALRAGLVVLAAVALGWQLFGAVSNLRAWLLFAGLAGAQLSLFAWAVLVLGLAIPAAAFAGALVVGRGRATGSFALVLLVAVCAAQAVGLSQLAVFQAGVGAL